MKIKRGDRRISLLCGISFIVFIFLTLDYKYFGLLKGLDIALNSGVEAIRTPALNVLMVFITNFMDQKILIFLAMILFVALFLMREKRIMFLTAVSMGGGYILETLLKIAIHRARPENIIVIENSFSFPSAHSVMSVIFFALLIYSFIGDIKNRTWKGIFFCICAAFPLLIGFSRIYLGAHWFTDVLGGFSLGLFWFSLMLIVFKKLR